MASVDDLKSILKSDDLRTYNPDSGELFRDWHARVAKQAREAFNSWRAGVDDKTWLAGEIHYIKWQAAHESRRNAWRRKICPK